MAPKGKIPTKFDTWDLHENLSKKSTLVLKKGKIIKHVTRRPKYQAES
jgi:hypothetical protein